MVEKKWMVEYGIAAVISYDIIEKIGSTYDASAKLFTWLDVPTT